jgi:hypothetical protein
MEKIPGNKNRPEVKPDFDDSQWPTVDVRADHGPLEPGEMAVFRTHFQLTQSDLVAIEGAKLNFGMIDDEGWVYANGELAGESHDWNDAPSFDVRKFLHVGDNTIAVMVKNNEGPGGLDKGVALDLEELPAQLDWQRSAFNGLAEVIVQADTEAGTIQLTAHADGLESATTIIHAETCSQKPALSVGQTSAMPSP